nr:uncharacterized protein LOC113732084 isoform X2 [Coffea arabica]
MKTSISKSSLVKRSSIIIRSWQMQKRSDQLDRRSTQLLGIDMDLDRSLTAVLWNLARFLLTYVEVFETVLQMDVLEKKLMLLNPISTFVVFGAASGDIKLSGGMMQGFVEWNLPSFLLNLACIVKRYSLQYYIITGFRQMRKR